jgi:hypothetical protein
MVLLTAFLFDLHATVKDLKTLTGERQARSTTPTENFSDLRGHSTGFEAMARCPTPRLSP